MTPQNTTLRLPKPGARFGIGEDVTRLRFGDRTVKLLVAGLRPHRKKSTARATNVGTFMAPM